MPSVPQAGRRTAPARGTWRTLGATALAAAFFALTLAELSSGLGLADAARWVASRQRAFYDMVRALMRGSGMLAPAGFVGACFLYGLAHAAAPGHGKFAIAAAGAARRIPTLRLVALAAAASLAQAVTAIVLVYGALAVMTVTAAWAMEASRSLMEPASALLIIATGVMLVRQAVRGINTALARNVGGIAAWSRRRRTPAHADRRAPDGARCCGHRHGVPAGSAAAIGSVRSAAVLIATVGLRPCTGALFVLAAAWRFGMPVAGAVGAVAMALGTGLVVSLVAVAAATARGGAILAAAHAGVAAPALRLVAGAAVVLAGFAVLIAPLAG